MINIRTASDLERPRIAAFYAENGYTQVYANDDLLVLAESGGEICGAVRLCQEQDVLVLRGMRVSQISAPGMLNTIRTRLYRVGTRLHSIKMPYPKADRPVESTKGYEEFAVRQQTSRLR